MITGLYQCEEIRKIGIIKDKPSAKIMAEFVALRIHWRLIFGNKIHCSTQRLSIDYFIYFKFTPVFS